MFHSRSLVLFLFAGLLFSCQQKNDRVTVLKKSESSKPFVFRMNQLYTPAENEVNFPLWFEDSIIASRGIAQLKRSVFLVTGEMEDDIDLREIRNYFFNRKGKLDSMKVTYYFDDQIIGFRSFQWESKNDEMGFRRLLKSLKSYELVEFEDSFIEFEPVSKGVNSYCYQSNKYRKCFIPRRDFWGPFSVDSILKPSSEDQIVLGKAKIPFKKYSVSNKVHERNVQLYTYSDDGMAILSISRSEYPFDVKRSVIYDKDWRCMGYVDSTFSDGVFLTVTRAKISNNKSGLPVQLKKLKGGNKTEYTVVLRENYEYSFYEN